MNKITYLLFLISIAFSSCKKECHKTEDINVLKGKLKSWTEYNNSTDSSIELKRFNFIYDTISGDLIKVNIDGKFNSVYYPNVTSIILNKINGTTLQVVQDDLLSYKRIFNVSIAGKQILAIHEVDTLSATETIATTIIKSNGAVDSIYDIGYDPSQISDIKHYDFQYNNNNCTSYTTYSNVKIFTSQYITDTFEIVYSSLVNTRFLRFQIPGVLLNDNSSIMRILLSFLSIDGYYIIQPNANLIDSIMHSGRTEKYEYQLTGNRVSKMISKFDFQPSYILYNDIAYY